MIRSSLLALACAFAFTPAAQAHVTLEQQTAVAKSTYKGIFRVTHGCEGSPTTSVTVFLPEGFIGAKPMPKPGWTLEVEREKISAPPDAHGNAVTDRAARITWRGGRLLDSEYDEFVVRTSLPEKAGEYWVRVLQQCEKGQNDWAEVPVEGKPRPKFPPARLQVTPVAAPAAVAPAAAPATGHAHHNH